MLQRNPIDADLSEMFHVAVRALSRAAEGDSSTRRAPAGDQLHIGDRVTLRDGGSGTVIGFYRAADPAVVVRLEGGDSRTVPLSSLRRR